MSNGGVSWPPGGRVITGDVQTQLCDRRLDEEVLVKPCLDLFLKDRYIVAQRVHVLLELLDRVPRRRVVRPVGNLVPQNVPKDGAQGCANELLPLPHPAGSTWHAPSLPFASELVLPILDGSTHSPRCQSGGAEGHPLQIQMCCPLP